MSIRFKQQLLLHRKQPYAIKKSRLKVGGLLGGMEQRIGLFLYYGNKRLTVSKIDKKIIDYFVYRIYHILEN